MAVIYFPPLQKIFVTEALYLSGQGCLVCVEHRFFSRGSLHAWGKFTVERNLFGLVFADIVLLLSVTSTIFIVSEIKKWIERQRMSRHRTLSGQYVDIEDIV